MNKINILKIRTITKEYYLFLIIITFLLKIALVNLIFIKTIKNINNYISEINLVIKGKGIKQILNNNFYTEPSEVLVNGISKDSSCRKTCDLDEDKNNITLIFENQIKSCYQMFYNLENIIEIDLSFFDFSEVTNMNGMFRESKNLEKIKFGTINTSSIENMGYLFYKCYKLISIDLSNFNTSKVNNMKNMFGYCTNLKYLDLSKFDTSNVNNMEYMFCSCQSLIYLKLNSFHLSNSVNIDYAFDSISSYVKICTYDENIKNILSQNGKSSDCSNICFEPNIKIDFVNNKCIKSFLRRLNNNEDNNNNYKRNLEGSFILSDNKQSDYEFESNSNNYDRINETERIYSDGKDLTCYKNCKHCYGKGNETLNNCIECIDNFTFYKDSIYDNNCYEKCNFYHYFDNFNNFYCVNTCPINYSKIILSKNKCIDKCDKDDTYQYEYNNICYINCPNGTYQLEDNKDKICYDTNPDDYYLDNFDKIYKKCYETCNKCNFGGNISNHNCSECKENLIIHKNNLNISNCYIKCEHYYYFNESNEYHCTNDKKCPEQYNNLILTDKKCINDCANDDTYKYNYRGICYKECSPKTIIDKINYKCFIINNSYIIIDERDEIINKFRSEFKDKFNYSENKEDIIKNEKNLTLQITNTNNQKNIISSNISTINLNDCEQKLRDVYNINISLPLIILKVDYFSLDSLIPIIGYEIYHPITKERLNLSYCEEMLIKLNIPVDIDESKLYKYDPNSEYYTDNCVSYTSENGVDMVLSDRKKEYSNNNLALCEGNCNYIGYNKDYKQSSCNCSVKNEIDLISEIKEKHIDSNLEKEESESNSKSSLSSSNIISIKCTKALFSKEGLKKNISSYILLIFIGQFLLSILFFIKCGYRLLVNRIKKILTEKEKIQKFNNNSNQLIMSTKGNKIKNDKKSYGNKKMHFPPKKQNKNFVDINSINKSSKMSLRKLKLSKKLMKLNKKVKLIKNKTHKQKNKYILPNINQNDAIKISYNDYELNNFEYGQAILYDKRSCFNYYFSLIKRKIPLIFSFCPVEDYNSMIIKLCIFSLSFSIYYAINFIFFDDNIIHKIYENEGKYDFIFFLPKIAIAFAASYYITIIIKAIFLSERNIYNIRCQNILSFVYRISEKEKKNIIIKNSIFFISGLLFLVFFWMLLSSFGAIYPNTQIFIFKNTLICFSMSLFYPIFFNIFPCIFRMCALNSKRQNNECIYNFSKILQLL